MNYYKLGYSIQKKEVGTFPQVSEGELPVDMEDPRFIRFFIHKKAPENVLVPTLKLNASAKQTDLISASFPGMVTNDLISSKATEILMSGNTFGIQSFSTKLVTKSNEFVYHIIHPYEPAWDIVDINKSELILQDIPFGTTDERVYLPSVEALIAESERLKYLPEPKKIVFRKIGLIPSAFDFFCLPFIENSGSTFFVSEKIRDKMVAAGLTGFSITDV